MKERVCRDCHAEMAGQGVEHCPACGALVTQREAIAEEALPGSPAAEVDHRGIRLPRRHALGGVITPQ